MFALPESFRLKLGQQLPGAPPASIPNSGVAFGSIGGPPRPNSPEISTDEELPRVTLAGTQSANGNGLQGGRATQAALKYAPLGMTLAAPKVCVTY
jgi:hypothetical protein